MKRSGAHSDMKYYLEAYPKGRERKAKDKFIGWLIERKLKTGLTVDVIVTIVKLAIKFDRGWRYVLQHEPRLRGTDYSDKKVLEQEVKIELGYEGGTSEFKDIVDKF